MLNVEKSSIYETIYIILWGLGFWVQKLQVGVKILKVGIDTLTFYLFHFFF